jgi:hypothetical protein
MSDKKTRGRKGIKPFILKHITDLKIAILIGHRQKSD